MFYLSILVHRNFHILKGARTESFTRFTWSAVFSSALHPKHYFIFWPHLAFVIFITPAPLHPKENLHSPKAVPSIIWDHLATTGCGRWQPKIVQNPRIDCQYIAKFFALQSNPQINCQYIANFSALHSASVPRSLCRNNIKLPNWIALTEPLGIFKVREDLLCYLWPMCPRPSVCKNFFSSFPSFSFSFFSSFCPVTPDYPCHPGEPPSRPCHHGWSSGWAGLLQMMIWMGRPFT